MQGVHAGPAPAHPVGIWIGGVGPKALALTGRIAQLVGDVTEAPGSVRLRGEEPIRTDALLDG